MLVEMKKTLTNEILVKYNQTDKHQFAFKKWSNYEIGI